VTAGVDEALRSIPDVRAKVDAADDYLREVIRRVELVLGELRPVSLYLPYKVDGKQRQIQLRCGRGGRWYVGWQGDDDSSIPLLSATRETRVEAFTAIAWPDHATALAPVEALVVAVNRELSTEAANRGPQMDVARRLEAMLEVAAGKLHGRDRPRADSR
jgi:hypothetical protein